MTPTSMRPSEDDRAFDARFAAMLPAVVHDDLAHARARRMVVALAEQRVVTSRPARASHLRVVTALAFAAATAAAAAVATRVYLAERGDSPAAPVAPEIHASPSSPVGTRRANVAEEAESARIAPDEEAVAPPRGEAPAEPVIAERGPRVAVGRAPAVPVPSAPPASPPKNDLHAPTAGERFGEAMRAYLAGDFATAEARFDAFCIDYAEDERAEDAAFLRADARAKHGDFQGARAAARSYLKRYPQGLRRPEAERLAAAGL